MLTNTEDIKIKEAIHEVDGKVAEKNTAGRDCGNTISCSGASVKVDIEHSCQWEHSEVAIGSLTPDRIASYLENKRVKDIIDSSIKGYQNLKIKFKIEPINLLKEISSAVKLSIEFEGNFRNIITFNISNSRWFHYRFQNDYDLALYALSQGKRIKKVVQDNTTDLVLLLWLIYIPEDGYEELLADFVKNYSDSRAEMIREMRLLQETGKLSINSRERLDQIIKISPFLEKQYSSDKKFTIMKMVTSGNIVESIERIKELTSIDISWNQGDVLGPTGSLKNISICAVIENNDLFK